MHRIAIVAALSACTSPPLEERLPEADKRVTDCGGGSGAYEFTVSGVAVDLDDQPVGGVTIDLTTAWGSGPRFPANGCRMGSAVSGADGRWGPVTIKTVTSDPIVVALASKDGLAPTLADRRGGSLFGSRTVEMTVVTVPADVATAWREELYADGMEFALNRGLVAYQFLGKDRRGAAGVTPSSSDENGDEPKTLAVDRAVRFLETSTTLAPPGTRRTTPMGYALIGRPPNGSGYYEVSGVRDSSRWREVGVIAATGWIYFESDEPAGQ